MAQETGGKERECRVEEEGAGSEPRNSLPLLSAGIFSHFFVPRYKVDQTKRFLSSVTEDTVMFEWISS